MLKRQTALIVDDDERLAATLATALRGVGFEARTARNGVYGYSSYFRKPTDWVVTDVEMAELNGIDMMQCIRAINSAVKTIYMTGSADKYWAVLTQESREFGAEILRKPFALNRLIDQMTDERRLRSKSTTTNFTKKTASRALSG